MANPLSGMKPTHKHDCTRCVFLASVTSGDGDIDWYICGDSMIGRYDSEPSHNVTPYWENPAAQYVCADGERRLSASALIAWALRQLSSAVSPDKSEQP